MNKNKSSNLFLLELIIAIFFFALASGVCAQIFASAHTLTEESSQLNSAVNHTTTVASILTMDGDTTNLLLEEFPQLSIGEDKLLIYWYDDLDHSIHYSTEIKINEKSGIIIYDISVFALENTSPIYELEVYKGLGGAAYE